MKKTVVELDLIGYSTICDNIEQGLDVHSVPQLNAQIQGFVDAGLAAVNLPREQTVVQTTGDGAILVFDSAADAPGFAVAVHEATAQCNGTRTQPLAKRVFRIGAATGHIMLEPKDGGGFEIAGMTIARAVRLEAKAAPGGFLIDEVTFADLPSVQKGSFGPPQRIPGKRDEVFIAHLAQPYAKGPQEAEFFIAAQNAALQEAEAATRAFTFDRDKRREVITRLDTLKTHQYSRLLFLLGIPIQQRPAEALNIETRFNKVHEWAEENDQLDDLLDILRKLTNVSPQKVTGTPQAKTTMNNQQITVNPQISSIIELIASDKLEEALSKLRGLPLPRSIANRIVMQSARLTGNTQDALDGIITRETSKVERTRIAAALLGLVREIESSSDQSSDQKQVADAELLVAVRQLESGFAKDHGEVSGELEAVHGVNNLKSISWIEMGVRASRSVCRILISTSKGTKFGTGFLIAPGRVMTNNHVISSIDEAREATIEFNYQLSAEVASAPTVRYVLDPDQFFHTSVELDYTVLTVQSDPSKPSLEKWDTLMLNADAEPIRRELVAVIQHPNGQVKQVVLSASTVVQVKSPLLHYTSDTMGGSSGSPVFNDLWQVVAIHHRAGPVIGGVDTNEGILMSAIRPHLGANWP